MDKIFIELDCHTLPDSEAMHAEYEELERTVGPGLINPVGKLELDFQQIFEECRDKPFAEVHKRFLMHSDPFLFTERIQSAPEHDPEILDQDMDHTTPAMPLYAACPNGPWAPLGYETLEEKNIEPAVEVNRNGGAPAGSVENEEAGSEERRSEEAEGEEGTSLGVEDDSLDLDFLPSLPLNAFELSLVQEIEREQGLSTIFEQAAIQNDPEDVHTQGDVVESSSEEEDDEDVEMEVAPRQKIECRDCKKLTTVASIYSEDEGHECLPPASTSPRYEHSYSVKFEITPIEEPKPKPAGKPLAYMRSMMNQSPPRPVSQSRPATQIIPGPASASENGAKRKTLSSLKQAIPKNRRPASSPKPATQRKSRKPSKSTVEDIPRPASSSPSPSTSQQIPRPTSASQKPAKRKSPMSSSKPTAKRMKLNSMTLNPTNRIYIDETRARVSDDEIDVVSKPENDTMLHPEHRCNDQPKARKPLVSQKSRSVSSSSSSSSLASYHHDQPSTSTSSLSLPSTSAPRPRPRPRGRPRRIPDHKSTGTPTPTVASEQQIATETETPKAKGGRGRGRAPKFVDPLIGEMKRLRHNSMERRRRQQMSEALDKLRDRVTPPVPEGRRKLPKAKVLQLAHQKIFALLVNKMRKLKLIAGLYIQKMHMLSVAYVRCNSTLCEHGERGCKDALGAVVKVKEGEKELKRNTIKDLQQKHDAILNHLKNNCAAFRLVPQAAPPPQPNAVPQQVPQVLPLQPNRSMEEEPQRSPAGMDDDDDDDDDGDDDGEGNEDCNVNQNNNPLNITLTPEDFERLEFLSTDDEDDVVA